MGGQSQRGLLFLLLLLVMASGIPGCGSGGASPRLIDALLEQRAERLEAGQRQAIVDGLVRAQRRTTVDALLLLAVIEQESSYRAAARSPGGALGLMQLRPTTARDLAERHGLSWDGETTLLDPADNVLLGAI